MSKSAVSRIVARAIMDPKFRAMVAQSPQTAAKRLRVKLTPDEQRAIGSMKVADWDKMTLKDIDSRIATIAAAKYTTITYTTERSLAVRPIRKPRFDRL